MNISEKLNLIEGCFSNEDAREILTNIFLAKIHFHEMKNFSSQERFGIDDAIAKKRIPELKKEMEKVDQIVSEAKLKNKQLAITSAINISLADE